jgi:hypothetical protein
VAARAQERRADEKEHAEREAEYKDVAKESGLVRGGKLKPPKTAKYGSGQDDNELEANQELASLDEGRLSLSLPILFLYGESLQVQQMSVTNNSAPSYIHAGRRRRARGRQPRAGPRALCPRPPGAVKRPYRPLAFPYENPFCMALLYGRAGRLTTLFRPGQSRWTSPRI